MTRLDKNGKKIKQKSSKAAIAESKEKKKEK